MLILIWILLFLCSNCSINWSLLQNHNAPSLFPDSPFSGMSCGKAKMWEGIGGSGLRLADGWALTMISLFDWRLCGASLHPWEKGQTLGWWDSRRAWRFIESSRLPLASPSLLASFFFLEVPDVLFQQVHCKFRRKVPLNSEQREHDLITKSFRWWSGELGGVLGFLCLLKILFESAEIKI